jgi:aldehyde oxidoreductase
MYDSTPGIPVILNGNRVLVDAPAHWRLTKALRDSLKLDGTKVGCDAGDCGACTVLVDGEAACACLIALGQVEGCEITTIEGLAETRPVAKRLQDSFLRHGAAQCGICTPGMLVAATALLERDSKPSEAEVQDALGGVLCRCTGYRKIVAAVLDARSDMPAATLPHSGAAVGARIERLDGQRKVSGADIFGADAHPEDALLLRVIRSPHHHARFKLGDLAAYQKAHPGILRILTAADVPGENCFGVIPPFADQPVFAIDHTRFRGEAIAAVIGDPAAIDSLDVKSFPVTWQELPAQLTLDEALAADAIPVHDKRTGNILVRGRVVKGDVDKALAEAPYMVDGVFETGFVEHAYIEPEAGFARRVGDRIEIQACTQAPYMDRDDIAKILGQPPESVRIIPTAVGGGFGAKLDLSVQPFIALAAWVTGKPVRMVYSRTESITTTTKRHPGRMRVRVAADRNGKLIGMDFQGDFNTGAYASWGPTVANRVPVHASGPYFVPHYRALTRAVHTHVVPAGAFRGFGVPQAGVAQEQLYDMLADKIGMDRLEFRLVNALRPDQPTVTGQVLGEGTGIRACFESLQPHWRRARDEAERFNALQSAGNPVRRGVGLAGMWYGCGNTSLPNPSTMRLGLKPDGRVALHQGAVDIGQGSNSVITQICADALGAPLAQFDLLSADTDITPDCGKTSASRQTFVSGKAAQLAGNALRARILRLANAGADAMLAFHPGHIIVRDGAAAHRIDLGTLAPDQYGYVLMAEETFDPPTSPLDGDGQGIPYAVYGFGAHLVELEVDEELGTVKLLKITAAHDVGRAINPTLVEGQIEGGIAQGIGLALMEEFHPGRGENLHDYLIPTIGDVPPIESILIEDASPIGPFGAKGIGEQALIPTAPAILNAIADATGVRLTRVPATPDRIRAAILEARS